MQLSCCCENRIVMVGGGGDLSLQPSQLHFKTVQQMIVAQFWLTISELIYSMPDFPEIWRYNCFLIHCRLCFDSMRFCCCMCTFSQVRYGDPHLLTISFKLEFTAGAISNLSMKKLPHIHTHNSKSSLKGPPDSPIPSLNTSQILPLQRKANPPSICPPLPLHGPPDTAQFSFPPTPLAVSQPSSITFTMTKNIWQ